MAVGIQGVHYHIGIATCDLDRAMQSVGETFGLRWTDVQHGVDVQLVGPDGPVRWELRRVVHSLGGPMRVELLEGGPGSVWETDRVSVLHHLAYWVDDIGAQASSLRADGWSIEVTVHDEHEQPTMFAYMTKPGNARVELTDSARRDPMLDRLGYADWKEYLR